MASSPSASNFKQGTILYFDFGPPSENRSDEGLLREKHYAVVLQMDGLSASKTYPLLLVCGLTSTPPVQPAGWVVVPHTPGNGLDHTSYADAKRIYTIRKDQVSRVVGTIQWEKLEELKRLLAQLFAIEVGHLPTR